MNFTTMSAKVMLAILLAAAVCVDAADTPTATVKGYVLDSAWPIADTTPSSGQNAKLLPFAGEKVTASGKIYQRGGSKAIVIAKIEAQSVQK